MEIYFTNKFGFSFKRRLIDMLPTVLNKDLSQLKPSKSFKTKGDSDQVRTLTHKIEDSVVY